MIQTSSMAKQWSHGLFGCFDDCGTCIVTFFCPCYSAGKNAEAVGAECYVLCGLATCIPVANVFFMAQIRSKIREQNRIEGTFLNDFMVTCCCPLCMLVQSSQEVKESRTVVCPSTPSPSNILNKSKSVSLQSLLNFVMQCPFVPSVPWVHAFLCRSHYLRTDILHNSSFIIFTAFCYLF